MIITSLEPVGKTRVQVSIDGEKAFVLYRNEAYRMGIREGGSIPEKVYEEIMQEILPKRAKLRCMNILKSGSCAPGSVRAAIRRKWKILPLSMCEVSITLTMCVIPAAISRAAARQRANARLCRN